MIIFWMYFICLEYQRRSFLEAEKLLKRSMITTYAQTILVCSDTLVNYKIWRVRLLSHCNRLTKCQRKQSFVHFSVLDI